MPPVGKLDPRLANWIPAFAGMTGSRSRKSDKIFGNCYKSGVPRGTSGPRLSPIGVKLTLVSMIADTCEAKKPSKSPFFKGGFRGIFSALDQNPPCPPFRKGGEFAVKLTPMGFRRGDEQACGISDDIAFHCKVLQMVTLDNCMDT